MEEFEALERQVLRELGDMALDLDPTTSRGGHDDVHGGAQAEEPLGQIRRGDGSRPVSGGVSLEGGARPRAEGEADTERRELDQAGRRAGAGDGGGVAASRGVVPGSRRAAGSGDASWRDGSDTPVGADWGGDGRGWEWIAGAEKEGRSSDRGGSRDWEGGRDVLAVSESECWENEGPRGEDGPGGAERSFRATKWAAKGAGHCGGRGIEGEMQGPFGDRTADATPALEGGATPGKRGQWDLSGWRPSGTALEDGDDGEDGERVGAGERGEDGNHGSAWGNFNRGRADGPPWSVWKVPEWAVDEPEGGDGEGGGGEMRGVSGSGKGEEMGAGRLGARSVTPTTIFSRGTAVGGADKTR